MDNLDRPSLEPRELNERGFRFIKASATLLLNQGAEPRPISIPRISPTCSAASASISSPSVSRANPSSSICWITTSGLDRAFCFRRRARCARKPCRAPPRRQGRPGEDAGCRCAERSRSAGLSGFAKLARAGSGNRGDATSLPEIIERFAPLAETYDVLLCDVWGVVHNGVAAFAPACEALMRFRADGGTVILITNAPRPGAWVQKFLDRLGVPRDAYDAITSSGDVTRGIVESRMRERVFHLGPERDAAIFAGLDISFAPIESADYVVCTGLFDDTRETPESYRELLAACGRARCLWSAPIRTSLSSVATNWCTAPARWPMPTRRSAAKCFIAASRIRRSTRRRSEGRGLSRRRRAAAKRVLAIGDSVRTDLEGRRRFRHRLSVRHFGHPRRRSRGREAADLSSLNTVFATAGVAPKAVTRALAW